VSRFITPRPKSFFCPKCGNRVETEGKNCLPCEQAALEKIADNNLRNTGVFGSSWGADVIVSEQVPSGTVLPRPNGISLPEMRRIGQMVQQSQISVGIEYLGETGSILPLTPGHQGYSADDFEEET